MKHFCHDSEGLPLSWYPGMVFVEESSNHDSLPRPDPFWINSIVDPLIKPYHQHGSPQKSTKKFFPIFSSAPHPPSKLSYLSCFCFTTGRIHVVGRTFPQITTPRSGRSGGNTLNTLQRPVLDARLDVKFFQIVGKPLPLQLLISPDSFLPLEVWEIPRLGISTHFLGANCFSSRECIFFYPEDSSRHPPPPQKKKMPKVDLGVILGSKDFLGGT